MSARRALSGVVSLQHSAPASAPPTVLPIFLRLQRQPVLVVGAGANATERIEALLAAGARVTVLAPEATVPVRAHAEAGRLEWKRRRFRQGDVIGYRLVVASTADPDVNAAVSRDARGWSLPVNVADVAELSDFHFGSVVRRGPVTVAVSTSGASPALARRLRDLLDRLLPDRSRAADG